MKVVANVTMSVEIPNEEEFRRYVETHLGLELATTDDAITELIASWVLRSQHDINFPNIKVIPHEIITQEVGHDLP